MKKLLVLAATLVASVSGFAFFPTQNKPAVVDEVHQRTRNGETLNMQAAAGKTGGVMTDIMACSLVDAGYAEKDVVDAMIRVGFDAKLVINGAICQDANHRDALVAVALRLGIDPAALLTSTAAGGSAAGGIGENGSGFNGANFGQSRAATVGGGGRGSVSKS